MRRSGAVGGLVWSKAGPHIPALEWSRRLYSLDSTAEHGSQDEQSAAEGLWRQFLAESRMKQSGPDSEDVLWKRGRSEAFADGGVPRGRDGAVCHKLDSQDSWSQLCDDGLFDQASRELASMDRQGRFVSRDMLYRVLKGCIANKDLVVGRRIHALVAKRKFESNAFLASHIIRMYASHGNLLEAKQVFSKLPAPDEHVWASIISAHGEQGQALEAIELYQQLRMSRVKPNSYIFVAVLKACACLGDISSGRLVHADIVYSALESNVCVGASLVDMYCKCKSVRDARAVFDGLITRNVVTWNAIISGYVQNGLAQEALDLHELMQQDDRVSADYATFKALLKACAMRGDIQKGRQIHADIQKQGLQGVVSVGNTLVDMYAKCESLVDARTVFEALSHKDVVSWNVMIQAYTHHELGQDALDLYERMQQEVVMSDKYTLVAVLQACGMTGAVDKGKQIHAQIRETVGVSDLFVWNAVVNMYLKCGCLDDARSVFDGLPARDIVTWSAMIGGYALHGSGPEAFDLYESMQREGTKPDRVTFINTLKVCGSIGALQAGRQIHSEILDRGLEQDPKIGSALVDMYAKCGSLEDAQRVFDGLILRNVVTWNSLINGYGQHNNCELAMDCFEEMKVQGVQPDDCTFLSLLTACSHMGLVSQGQEYFKMMVEGYGIAPTVEHYNCMVDLLGRSGHMDEAEQMLQTLPFGNDCVGWRSLLTACNLHGDVGRGRLCFDRLLQLEPQHGSAYVLMSSLYATAGRLEDAWDVDRLRIASGVRKKPAKAFIEVNQKMHQFTVGDEELSPPVTNVHGFPAVPAGNGNDDNMCGHAERLALSFGLLNTPAGSTLLVTKSLRMCSTCHSVAKVLSQAEKRELIVRDAHRVHHFRDGMCSCGDAA